MSFIKKVYKNEKKWKKMKIFDKNEKKTDFLKKRKVIKKFKKWQKTAFWDFQNRDFEILKTQKKGAFSKKDRSEMMNIPTKKYIY